MAGDKNHKVPGERLSQRLTSRTARRPRMGMSPAFYLRFGMEDPWLGGLPEGPVGADHDDPFGFTYVSRRAYDQHLLRLAWARRRRDDRMERLTRRYGVVRLKAASRRWPGERARPRMSWGLVSVSERDMILPPAPALESEEDLDESGVPVVSAFGGPRHRSGSRPKPQAWLSREHAPAKVFKTPRSPLSVSRPAPRVVVVEKEVPVAGGPPSQPVRHARPAPQRRSRALDQAGARLEHTVRSAHPVARELERIAQTASSPRVRLEARRVIEQVVDLPQAQQVQVVRRVLRKLGPAARVVRTEVVREIDDRSLVPVDVAEERMATRQGSSRSGSRRRGLRPVMGSSPLVNALRPDLAPPAGAAPARSRRAAPAAVPAVADAQPGRTLPALHDAGSAVSAPAPRDLRASLAGRAALRLTPSSSDRLLPAPVQASGTVAGAPRLFDSPVARTAPAGAADEGLDPAAAPGRATAQAAARLSLASTDLDDLVEAVRADEPAGSPVVHRPAGETMGLRRHSVVRTARGAYLPAATVVQHEALPAGDDEAPEASAGARVVRGLGRHGSTSREQERAALEAVARELLGRSGVPRELRAATAPAAVAAARSTAPRSAPVGTPAAETPRATRRARPEVAPRTSPLPRTFAATGQTSSAASHAAARAAVGGTRPGSLRPVVSVAHTMAPSGELARLPARVGRAVASAAASPAEAGAIASVIASVQQAPSPEAAERILDRLPPIVRAAVRAEAGAAQVASVVPKAIPGEHRLGAVLPAASASGAPAASQAAVARVADAVAPTLRTRNLRTSAPMAQLARPDGLDVDVDGAPAPQRTEGGTRVIRHRNVEGVKSTARTFVTERRPGQPAAARPVRVERQRPALPAATVAASTRDAVAPTVVNTVVRVLVDGFDVPASVARQVVRRTRPSPVDYARTPAKAAALDVDLRPLERLLEEEARKGAATAARSGSGRRMRAYAPSDTVLEAEAEAGTEGSGTAGGARVIRGMAADKNAAPQSTTRVVRSQRGVEGRPLDWVGDRVKGSAPAASSRRRPSFTESGERASSGQIMARAGTHRTPSNRWQASELVKGPDGRFQSARRFRTARNATLRSELTLPEAPATAAPTVEQSLEALADAAPAEVQRQLQGLSRSSRTHLTETLAAVDARQGGGDLPGWASRASGLPNVRGDGGQLLTALARATEVDEIVRVIVEQGGGLKSVPSSLPKPVIQVIEQIRAEAARPQGDEAAPPADLSRGISRSAYRQASRSSARVIKGFKSLRPTATGSAAPSGASANQLSKLSKRLKELIHLAEGGQRGEARRQVRMAEDSAAARQEGQSAPNSADTVGGQQVDVEALGREVLEVVSRELEMRRERRMGESDDFWW